MTITADKKIVELFSGRYLISSQRNLIISTLLGSCVAVCLFDEKSGTGGMNHFLLPQRKNPSPSKRFNKGKYGLSSLEKMLADFQKKGIDPAGLKGKVFGGARMMENIKDNIAEANIELAFAYLKKRKIPVLAKDVGGLFGRRIFFVIEDFSVYVKTFAQPLSSTKLSPQYFNSQSRQESKPTPVRQDTSNCFASGLICRR